jgi:uncharacterized protein (DUF58 family)
MIRPTQRLIAAAGAAAPLTVVLLLVDQALWTAAVGYLAGLLCAALADRATALPTGALRLDAGAPAQLFMGDEGALELRLLGGPRAAGLRVDVVVDLDERLEEAPATAARLDAAGEATVRLPLRPVRRGPAAVRRVWLRWTGPAGLVWRVRCDAVDLSCEAVPNMPAVKRAAIQLAGRTAEIGVKPQAAAGEGVEFAALREHQPGMDIRAIDWKHSARHRRLLCKEFAAERNHSIVLAYDTGQLMREPIDGAPKLDHAINAGLVLAYQALKEGDLVGIYGFADRPGAFRRPIAGPSAFRRVADALNRLDYCPEETNYTLGLGALMDRLTRRSIVVLLTDILDTVSAELMVRNLGRLSRDHLVVFVALREPWVEAAAARAPRSAAELAEIVVTMELDDERAAVLKRLRRIGIDPIDAAPQALSTALLNRYLDVKRQAAVELA